MTAGKVNLWIFILALLLGIISIITANPNLTVISLSGIILGVIMFILRKFVSKVLDS